MRAFLLFCFAITGCMYSHVSGDPGEPEIGEHHDCKVILHCPGQQIEEFDVNGCTQFLGDLENELEYECREEAVANGCPATSYCTARCVGNHLACFFLPEQESDE